MNITPMYQKLSVFPVMIFLYFGLILQDWHYIEDIRKMVVPVILFGIFSGATVSSVFATGLIRRPALQAGTVCFISATIATLAILIHIEIMHYVPFKNPSAGYEISQGFYRTFAAVSVFLFCCSSMTGHMIANVIKEMFFKRVSRSVPDEKQCQMILSRCAAIIGLIGALFSVIIEKCML